MILAQEYFPIISDAEYIYEGTGNEFASFSRFTDYTNNKKQQFRIDNGKTQSINIYKSNFLGVKLIYSQGKTNYRENFLGRTPNKKEYILLNPISIGRHWTLHDRSIRTITNVDIPIETPFRTFSSTVEVTTTNGEYIVVDYYAKDIGLIKTSLYSENTILATSVLKEIKKSIPLTQAMRFFYPNNNFNDILYVDRDINFFTNDLTKIKIQNEFRTNSNNFSSCIGPNTIINYLYYNEIDSMVYIDFSCDFVNDLNTNPKYEYLNLLSITNSIGKYYNEPKVYITVDGNPYNSRYIQKQPREPFLTDFDNINLS